MNAPIEAQSISSLTTLLANPPNYPRNPTHQVHEPLVLYIVRVPGSQDVFLTPLKPPTKASISLEAIQSSLYYLHVETAEDEAIKSSLEEQRTSQELKEATEVVLRKPLPSTPYANYPSYQRPRAPPKSYPDYQPPIGDTRKDTQSARFLGRGLHIRLHNRGESLDSAIPRKPIGARPLFVHNVSASTDGEMDRQPDQTSKSSTLDNSWSRLNRKPISWSPRLENCHESISPLADGYNADEISHDNPDDHMKGSENRDVVRITLIRRDPTSGSQWNVGTVFHALKSNNHLMFRPVDVVLNTPGYGKLARSSINQLPTSGKTPDLSLRSSIGALAESFEQQSPICESSNNTFKRSVNYRMLPSLNLSTAHQDSDPNEVLASVTNRSSKKPRQAYSFLSPWQGLCTFSHGIDGRSLRCQHTLPTLNTAQSLSAANLAELRFNLPWSLLSTNENHKQAVRPEAETLPISELLSHPSKENWRRSVQNLRSKSWNQRRVHDTTSPRARHSQFDEYRDGMNEFLEKESAEDEGRISLKLGREKAGGGFKGKSAKLGKLILHDEGLKMGDLVVAACMGVWWQHYTDAGS